MKRLLMILICLLPMSAAANNSVVDEGALTADWPIFMLVNPGMLLCPGGETLPDPVFLYVCSEGANIKYRGTTLTWMLDADNDDLDGAVYVTVNSNWDENGEGPYYGDFSIVPYANSISWHGTFTSKRTYEDGQWVSNLSAVLYASGYDAPPYQMKISMSTPHHQKYPASYEWLNWILGTSYTGPEGSGTYVIKRSD